MHPTLPAAAPAARCLELYASAQAAHAELRRPLTWNGAQALCRRLGVPVLMRPMPVPAQVVGALGTSVVLLDSNTPPRRHTYLLAHELAHVLLGHTGGREGVVYHLTPCAPDDPREDDAELLATLMLQGPRFARHF